MEIYKILDRFETLYPTNTDLSNLRRAYIDQDLNSIFALLADSGEIGSPTVDDIRSMTVEHNLHSLFRVVADEDLRKLMLQDNKWSLWKVLARYTDSHFVAAFKSFMANGIEYDEDCFSRGQLQSKTWLVDILEELEVDLGTVFLCAGWYATLATMIFESGIKVDKIRSFDIDESTVSIAEVFNKPWFVDNWRFKASTVDIMDFNWTTTPAPSDGSVGNFYYKTNANDKLVQMKDNPDTIINTSCEHIANFDEWYAKIPSGKLVILQSNNYFEIKEHVNCSASLDAFKSQTPMTEELYSGELQLSKYKRFMRIGYK